MELSDLLNLQPTVAHKQRTPLPRKPVPQGDMTHTAQRPPEAPSVNRDVTLRDYLSAVKGLAVGSPEKVLTGEQSQIDTPFGGIPYLSGSGDLLAALPLFGTAGEAARGIMKGMRTEPFFSALRRGLETKLPETFTGEQALNVARKASKAEELEWSGLEGFLRPTQKYSKADLAKFLDENAPELREHIVGPVKKPLPQQHLLDEFSRPGASPQFTKYTLPGGQNHRELVVTMPSKIPAPPPMSDEEKFHTMLKGMDWGNVYDQVDESVHDQLKAVRESLGNPHPAMLLDDEAIGALTPDLKHELRSVYDHARRHLTDEEMGIYQERPGQYQVPRGHTYGDPELDVNRLLHMRMNDRTTSAGERALHVDELQSDWHQAGRKEGYRTKEPTTRTREEIDSDLDNGLITDEEYERELAQHEANKDSAVPDAPFKKTWHELGMKRALQEAAAGGYDRLTWTTGQQQADRYDLSKLLDKILYNPQTGELRAFDKKGAQQLVQYPKTHEELEGMVGKEMADRLVNSPTNKTPVGRVTKFDGKYVVSDVGVDPRMPTGAQRPSFDSRDAAQAWVDENMPAWHTVTGADLSVGGEGMKGFYDQMLPSYAGKLGKKWGVAPEKVTVNAWNPSNPPMTMFQEGPPGAKDPNAWTVTTDKGVRKAGYLSQDEAKALMDKLNYERGGQDVWSLRITPQMRRDLLREGQPLYEATPPMPLPLRRRTQDATDGQSDEPAGSPSETPQ